MAGSASDHLAELNKRIDALELNSTSRRETRFLRFGAIAGVVSTILSILTGGLSVYSNTVQKAGDEQQALFTQFSTHINAIIADNQKIAELSNLPSGQAVNPAAIQNINTAKFNTLAEARQIFSKVSAVATLPQIVMLATETGQIGDRNQARILMNQALDKADAVTLPETLRMQGRLLATSSDLADRRVGLAAFARSLKLTREMTSIDTRFQEGQILHDWILASAWDGDCTTAQDLINQFDIVLENQPGIGFLQTDFKMILINEIKGNQIRCTFDNISLGL